MSRKAGIPPAMAMQQGERDARVPDHKFWHSRGYLPHCDTPGLLQAITFRLADALPADVLERLQKDVDDDAQRRTSIENLLDAGHGACWLKQPSIADIVRNALLHWDGQRYRLLAWCVIPNHVHVLIETRAGSPLPEVLHSWKSFTAKAINRHLGRTGAVWMRDYFDRFIRDDPHLAAVIAYIHGNPVKAGLVQNEQDWPHSSARRELRGARASCSPQKEISGRDARVPAK
ncbi:MAG: transposase [Sulfurimicrobium sp.]|nr:transposase [Sulfurimicrobium sp.]MDP1703198.1 transposase [Sulfurimicrobium sp.]MDP2199094.1 transposase [Sulfurimicrobium sp.]MDP3687329.1 transposase [Sulfurimicrobium sp.]